MFCSWFLGLGQGGKTEEAGVQKPLSCSDRSKQQIKPRKETEYAFGKYVRLLFCFSPEKAHPFRTMGRNIGYARCSTTHQSTDSQVDDLKADGCEEVFFEKVSSTTTLDKRHQLRACLSVLRKGDLLVVSKLDRLGRSQVEVINRLNDLQQQGIHVRTLDGLIDTQALGKLAPLVVGLLTGLSEVARSLIQERTRESVEHRRKTGGNLGGRPKTSDKKESLVLRLRQEGESYRSIKEQTGLALATITRIVKEQEAVQC